MGKSRCSLLQESHCRPVTYPRHKQDPLLSFINDFEPKGLQFIIDFEPEGFDPEGFESEGIQPEIHILVIFVEIVTLKFIFFGGSPASKIILNTLIILLLLIRKSTVKLPILPAL